MKVRDIAIRNSRTVLGLDLSRHHAQQNDCKQEVCMFTPSSYLHRIRRTSSRNSEH